MNTIIKSFVLIFLSFVLVFLRTVAITVAIFVLGLVWGAGDIKAQVVINEFMPNPEGSDGSGNEWVEFYNTGSQEVDLSQHYFDDDNDFDGDIGKGIIQLSGVLQAYSLCYLGLSSYLNNDGDVPTLFKEDKSIADSYPYSSSTEGKSYSRIPDGGDWQSDQNPSKTEVQCQDLAPLPTSTPTNTNTPAPTSESSATLRVKEVKDENGAILSNVKIYIDSIYTHHYAPEDINFCENCKCDGCDSQIDLKFGSYVIKLEKSGYESWSETKDIQSGNTVDIDVVLKEEVASTNTPTVTKKSTSTPTKKEKVKAAKTTGNPTAGRDNLNEVNIGDDDLVLGINEEIDISDLEDKEGVSQGGKIPLTAGVFIAGGLVLVVAAAYPTLKVKLLEWGMKGEPLNEGEIN
jgi:hypothetical protein